MNTQHFTKMVATGNDFVVIDNRRRTVHKNLSSLAKRLCAQKHSVGADGLLVLERSKTADFAMRIFNPDGSEAAMCGNGSRCIALYAALKKIAPTTMTIETMAGILNATVRGDDVKVKLTDPTNIQWNLCLMIEKCPYRVEFVNTGVPHVIHFVPDIDKVDVKNIGTHIRHHDTFQPEGANVDFVEIVDKHSIKVRTYERGVEDETLACGTGAVASAIISSEYGKMDSPITVITRSGEKLKIHFEIIDGEFKNVYLAGRAALVYEGDIKLT